MTYHEWPLQCYIIAFTFTFTFTFWTFTFTFTFTHFHLCYIITYLICYIICIIKRKNFSEKTFDFLLHKVGTAGRPRRRPPLYVTLFFSAIFAAAFGIPYHFATTASECEPTRAFSALEQ